MFVSALLMFRRLARAMRHAMREEHFGAILGAATALVVIGTIVYTFGGGWSVVDGFYFAVGTLTTSNIADPELVLTDPWLKVFTAFYVLVGLGVLIEVARRLGSSFVAVREQDMAGKRSRSRHDEPQ